MIHLADRLIGTRSGLRGQFVSYAVAGVLQGLTLAAVIPALRALFAEDLTTAAWWTVGALGASVATGIVTWVANNVGYDIGVRRLGGGLMHRIGRSVEDLPLGWFTDRTVGMLGMIMSSSVQNVLNLPSLIIQQLTFAVTTPATVVVVTAFVDWRLAVAFLPMVPIAWWLYRCIDRVGTKTDAIEAAAEQSVTERVVEFAQAQPVLRSSGRTVRGWSNLDEALRDDLEAVTQALKRKSRPTSAFTATVSLGFAVVFVVGVLLALGDRIDTATLVGVLVLAVRFVEPLSAVGAYGSGMTTARTALESIAAVVDAESLPETTDPRDPTDASIEFRNVSFGYDKTTVVSDLSLLCEPGTTTALVGVSGSGKTTLTRLIARFWDVNSGAVLIGGVDVRDIATTRLISDISFVFQHVYLVDGTILENVRMGRPAASDDEVLAAARDARLEEVVARLDGGWGARVGEGGGRLSGGERQRVSIARAILKAAPIVLLDEATAALDADNEAAVTEALRRLTEGRTVVVIAHRLHTVASADRIAVLDGGRIADLGTHDELVHRPGIYSQFWNDRLEAVSWRLNT